jgi:nucleotide-binding universal stress UspA family protein
MRMVLAQNQAGQTAVRVVHVVEPLNMAFYPDLTPPYPASLDDIRKGREKSGRELVERTVSQLQAAGFQADGVLRTGDAAPTVLDVADKWRADLIVLGSHGWKGLTRFLLGSVSDHVARHANCSVEIVRVPRRRKITKRK